MEMEIEKIPPTQDRIEYFEIKDQRYIDELKVTLSKLRRYRWLYRRSSEYYDKVNDIYCYYPILIISALVAIGSFVTANIINKNNHAAEAITYVVGILGILSGIIQKYQTKQDYPTKKIKFETGAGEIDILVTRVSGEIRFPNENPHEFVVEIENEMIKIKNDLTYQIPLHIIAEYNKLRHENPSEISSEDGRIPPMNPNKKNIISKNNFKLNCYDIDIEDDIKAQKTYEEKQKKVTDGTYQHNGAILQQYQVQSNGTPKRTVHRDFLRRSSITPRYGSFSLTNDNLKQPRNSIIYPVNNNKLDSIPEDSNDDFNNFHPNVPDDTEDITINSNVPDDTEDITIN